MTKYLAIEPAQEPFDMGVDGEKRSLVVFNVNAICEPTGAFLEEVAAVLVGAGVGVAAGPTANIFATSGHAVPPGEGPYLSIIESVGAPPIHIQNTRSPAGLVRPAAQILVRARPYAAARTMSRAAHSALLAILNTTVTP